MSQNYKKISVNALNKTGSMFLYRFYKDICAMKKIPYFSANNRPNNLHFYEKAKRGCVCPIRSFPEDLSDDVFYIFLLRNPLDVLVSEYFSWGWMHDLPPGGFKMLNKEKRNHIRSLNIDEYCMQYSDDLLKRYKNILSYNKSTNNTIFLKYSEMVLDFDKWINIAVKPFDLDQNQTKFLFKKYNKEFMKIKELNPSDIIEKGKRRHKRKMLPGDHKEKLKEETILELEEKFKDIIGFIESL